MGQREALLPTQDGDRFLCMMPLFHSFALATHLYQALWCAGTMVILPRYRPDWIVAALHEECITVLAAGATVSTQLLEYDRFVAEKGERQDESLPKAAAEVHAPAVDESARGSAAAKATRSC